MAKISTKLDVGYAIFEFEDTEGHVFSHFKVNPADLGIVKRAEEVSGYFNDVELNGIDNVLEKEHEIGEKMNYLLGYKSYEDIFGEIAPLTLLPDGKFFIEHVMEKVSDALEPIIAERQAKMEANMNKYTGKYAKKKKE